VVDQRGVGVLGATSLVGQLLLPRITRSGCKVVAFTREFCNKEFDGVEWRQLGIKESFSSTDTIKGDMSLPNWICAAPIWVLKDYFRMLEAYGVRRIVVLSSTSIFTKRNSSDPKEQQTVKELVAGEEELQIWAERHNVEWVILRPTLIYGLGLDKNITEIVRFIHRFGFFPIFGKADGLRQPIHVEDVADACIAALLTKDVSNRDFNLSGGEVVAYRDIVKRAFALLDYPIRILPVPLWAFRVVVVLLRRLRRYRDWSVTMATRMNSDMVFDHREATRILGFKPRKFSLSAEDLPEL